MTYELIPTALFLLLVGWFLHHNRGRLVVQVYVVIVVCYLNVFPAVDYILSSGDGGMERFSYFQMFIIYFFELILLVMLNRRGVASPEPVVKARMRLSILLPTLLAGLLAMFWVVSLQFDMFFVRIGYIDWRIEAPAIPTIPLYFYRLAVETSFFVIVFLSFTLRVADKRSGNYELYRWLLVFYLATFLLFFGANSRMQLLVLLLCLYCTRPLASTATARRRRPRLVVFALFAVVLIVGQTIFRELYLEETERIDLAGMSHVLAAIGQMVAARLDSVVMLYSLDGTSFNPFGFQWSGLFHVLNYNFAFFYDPATYAEIRQSEVTSPSVEIINRLTSSAYVDFPKSMIIDVFLSFGVYGLIVAGVLLGRIVAIVQGHVRRFNAFTPAFLTAIYTMPLLFQFEKEFLGFLVSYLKWSPLLLVVIYLRPRARTRAAPSPTSIEPAPVSSS